MNNQIKKINLNHSLIFFLYCNFFSLITFVINDFTISPLICLLLILSIGISHGSLDNVKGKKLFQIYLLIILLFFIYIYFNCYCNNNSSGLLFPLLSLIIFLIVASYHFGKEDTAIFDN